MRNNKKYFIALIAGITAAVGVIVAIGVYLRKKASIIGEQLDFDPDMYNDEDYFDAEEDVVDEESSMADVANAESAEADSIDEAIVAEQMEKDFSDAEKNAEKNIGH